TKRNCYGQMKFAKLIESKASNGAHGIVYDNGKIYISGNIGDTGKRVGYDTTFTSAYHSIFVASYDTSSKYNWMHFLGADKPTAFNGLSSGGGCLSTDAHGDIYCFTHLGEGAEIFAGTTN